MRNIKKIGNFKDWIDPAWREEIISKEGGPGIIAEWKENHDGYSKMIEGGWDPSFVYWWHYKHEHVSFALPTPPWLKEGCRFKWWFVKLMPGQVNPLHTDSKQKIKSYWIPLQDYKFGHVFLIDNQLINDYVLGDVFEFDGGNSPHGGSNISTSVRVVLVILEYLE